MTRPWQPLMTSAAGVEYFYRDNEDGTYTVWSSQENDPFLERNKAMATHNNGWSDGKLIRREGSIPMGLIQHWRETLGVNVLDPSGHDFLRKKLNDIDYQYLRTSPGKT